MSKQKHSENKFTKKQKITTKKKKDNEKKRQKRQQYYCNKLDKKKVVNIPICKYFIYGACKLDDCIYSHDVTPDQMKKFNEMCKYYPKGECAKGDMCCYMHELFPCQFFHSKKGNMCSKGSDCLFSHEPLTKEMAEILENHLKLQAPRDQVTEVTVTENNEPIQSNFGKSSLTPNNLDSLNNQNFGRSLFANSNLHNNYENNLENNIDENENETEQEMYQHNNNNNEEINLEIPKENINQNKENTNMTTFSNLFSRTSLPVDYDNNSLNNDSYSNIDYNFLDKPIADLPKSNQSINILESLASNINNIPKFTKIVDDSDSDCDLNICENVNGNENENRTMKEIYQNKENRKLNTFSNLFSRTCLPINNDKNCINSLGNDANLNINQKLINLPKTNQPINILENLASNINNIPKFTKMSDDSDSDCDLNIYENVVVNKWNSSVTNQSTETINKIIDKITVTKDSINTKTFTEKSSPNCEIEKTNDISQSNLSKVITKQNHAILFNEQSKKSNYSENMVTKERNDTLSVIDLNKSRSTEQNIENQDNIQKIDKISENLNSADNSRKLLGKRLQKNSEGNSKKRKKDELKLPSLSNLSTDIHSLKVIEPNKIKTLENDDKIKTSKKNERTSKRAGKTERPSKRNLSQSKPKLTPSIINSDSDSDFNRNNFECSSNNVHEPSFTSNVYNDTQINHNIDKSDMDIVLNLKTISRIDSSREISNDFEISSTSEDKDRLITNLSDIDDTEIIEWNPACISSDIKIIPNFMDSDEDDNDVDIMSKVVEIRNENEFQIENKYQVDDSKTSFFKIENIVEPKSLSQDVPVDINNEENQYSPAISSKSTWSLHVLNLSPQKNYHEMNINCYNLYHKFDDPRIRNHPRALKQSVHEWLASR